MNTCQATGLKYTKTLKKLNNKKTIQLKLEHRPKHETSQEDKLLRNSFLNVQNQIWSSVPETAYCLTILALRLCWLIKILFHPGSSHTSFQLSDLAGSQGSYLILDLHSPHFGQVHHYLSAQPDSPGSLPAPRIATWSSSPKTGLSPTNLCSQTSPFNHGPVSSRISSILVLLKRINYLLSQVSPQPGTPVSFPAPDFSVCSWVLDFSLCPDI